jgi:hypothetical protein
MSQAIILVEASDLFYYFGISLKHMSDNDIILGQTHENY